MGYSCLCNLADRCATEGQGDRFLLNRQAVHTCKSADLIILKDIDFAEKQNKSDNYFMSDPMLTNIAVQMERV